MKWMKRFLLASPALFLIVLLAIALRANLFGQQSTTPSPAPASGTSRSDLCRKPGRSEEHTSELQSRSDLVCRLLLEKKKNIKADHLHGPEISALPGALPRVALRQASVEVHASQEGRSDSPVVLRLQSCVC